MAAWASLTLVAVVASLQAVALQVQNSNPQRQPHHRHDEQLLQDRGHPSRRQLTDADKASDPSSDTPWEWPEQEADESHELAAAAALEKVSSILQAHHWLYNPLSMLDMTIAELQKVSEEAAAEAISLDEFESLPDYGREGTDSESLTDEQRRVLKEIDRDTWVFAGYRKSGCNLMERVMRQTSKGCSWDDERSVLRSPWEALASGDVEVFKPQDFSNHFCNPDLHVLQAMRRYKFVHLVRDPVQLVLSSYRFHHDKKANWLAVPIKEARNLPHIVSALRRFRSIIHQIPAAHQKALAQFAESVKRGSSLHDFYQEASQADGIIVEAYRSWPELDLLTSNFERTKDDRRSLQVRMESIQKDFKHTMRCMFNFLNESRWIRMHQCLEDVKNLHGYKAELMSSTRYNMSLLRSQLATVKHMEHAREIYSEEAVREC